MPVEERVEEGELPLSVDRSEALDAMLREEAERPCLPGTSQTKNYRYGVLFLISL